MKNPLFSPVAIGPAHLRNRTIRAAAFEGMCPDNRPSRALVDYHRSVATGGVGMTTVAYAAIERSGLSFPHQLLLRPEVIRPLRDLTDAIHEGGARASIQIGHAGNMASPSAAAGRPIAPSARLNLYGPTWPRAMDQADIDRVAASFGRAVEVARDAGFDAVEVHAGHGYLISQFLSPYTNRRHDAYGGSLDNRLRFLRQCVSRARAAARDDMAVLVKTNLRDGFRGGMELDEGVRVAQALEQLGVHALVLSGGFVSRAPMYILRGAMPLGVMGRLMPKWWLRASVPLAGDWLVPEVPYREGYFLEDAAIVRGEVKLPLVYVGGAASRATIDRVLAQGFEAVAMARALIREPDFVNRLKAEEAVSPCDHCNYCAARIYGTSMSCHHLESPPSDLARRMHRGAESRGAEGRR